ncbi:MAG: hypothetical protein IT424_05280 [Pirellulales bacterium]|nr:hypothetical protein [Pirellulales bacterium]
MHLAVTMLMASVLASTGLLALALAASRRHWFLRTSAFLIVLAPLLLVPAYEVFIGLALEAGIIAVGADLARRRDRRDRDSRPNGDTGRTPPRFSLTSLLLGMVLCGVAAAVAARAPRLNPYGWASIAIVAFCGAAATLIAAWAARRRTWIQIAGRLLIGLCIVIALAAIPYSLDGFLPALVVGGAWPPMMRDPSNPISNLIQPGANIGLLWFGVMPAAFAACATILLLAMPWRTRRPKDARAAWKRRLAFGFTRGLAAACVVLVVAPAGWTLWKLLTPEPVPVVRMPQSNAYDDFVAAGQSIVSAAINSANFDPDTALLRTIRQAVAEVRPAIERTRDGLAKPFMAPVDFKSHALPVGDMTSLRSLARALRAEGRLAELEGNIEQALAAHLDIIRLGYQSRRGGLIVNGQVGSAITGVGASGVYNLAARLSRSQCLMAIDAIKASEALSESYAALERRDQLWEQHALDWFGGLHFVLDRFCGGGHAAYGQSFVWEEARTALLKAHLALLAYYAEHSRWPADWREVVAAGLPPLPIDPHDPAGGAIRYRRTDIGYLLYSVGGNQIDDRGAAPPQGDTQAISSGDLRLDLLLAPVSPPNSPPAAQSKAEPRAARPN